MKDRAVVAVLAGVVLAVVAGLVPAAAGMFLLVFPSKASRLFEAVWLWPAQVLARSAADLFFQTTWWAAAVGLEICFAVGTVAGVRGLRRDGVTRRSTGLLLCAAVAAAIFGLVPSVLYLQTKKTLGLMDESTAEGLEYERSHLEHPAGLAYRDRELVRRLWHDYARDAYTWSGRIVQIPEADGSIHPWQPTGADEEVRRNLAALRSRVVPPYRETVIFAARLFLYLLLGFLTPISRRSATAEVPAGSAT